MKRSDSSEKRYYANEELGEEIVKYLKDNTFYDATKEKVTELMKKLDKFVSEIKMEEVPVTLSVHETEEEAREFFGNEFVQEFDELMKKIDKENCVMAIHGTSMDSAKSIAKEGLYYKDPALLSTALIQDRALEGYQNYEMLLNWPHREYKGLVLLGIPYECFYKEPLWEKQDVDINSERKVKIRPEYIIGYIDVLDKKIIYNSGFKRDHNYNDLEFDMDVFHKRDITNDKFWTIEKSSEVDDEIINQPTDYVPDSQKEDREEMDNFGYYDPKDPYSNIATIADELKGIINRCIGFGSVDERVYADTLRSIETAIKYLGKDLPKIKTNEELENERKMEEERWKNAPKFSSEDFDEWEEWNKYEPVDFDYDEEIENSSSKGSR